MNAKRQNPKLWSVKHVKAFCDTIPENFSTPNQKWRESKTVTLMNRRGQVWVNLKIHYFSLYPILLFYFPQLSGNQLEPRRRMLLFCSSSCLFSEEQQYFSSPFASLAILGYWALMDKMSLMSWLPILLFVHVYILNFQPINAEEDDVHSQWAELSVPPQKIRL